MTLVPTMQFRWFQQKNEVTLDEARYFRNTAPLSELNGNNIQSDRAAIQYLEKATPMTLQQKFILDGSWEQWVDVPTVIEPLGQGEEL